MYSNSIYVPCLPYSKYMYPIRVRKTKYAYIEFEYVKQSTNIEFEYVFRVIRQKKKKKQYVKQKYVYRSVCKSRFDCNTFS